MKCAQAFVTCVERREKKTSARLSVLARGDNGRSEIDEKYCSLLAERANNDER